MESVLHGIMQYLSPPPPFYFFVFYLFWFFVLAMPCSLQNLFLNFNFYWHI